jgi:hypothetical protein
MKRYLLSNILGRVNISSSHLRPAACPRGPVGFAKIPGYRGQAAVRWRLRILEKMKCQHALASLLLLVSLQSISIAAPTVQIEPSQVQLNTPFQLIISTDSLKSRKVPDLRPLEHDFTILGTQQSSSYTIVNGQTTSLSQWVILLRPKKAGKLPIPSIKIGSEQTEPSVIDVVTTDSSTSSSNNEKMPSNGVMLKTTISEEHPYINQQVLYTVRLYNNRRLLNAEYHPPSVEEALMIPLGNGRHYQTQQNGETYGVEEQQYAIFPQKSGSLTINSPSFNAAVYDDIPKQLTLKTKVSKLSVLPAPTEEKNWLPAKKVILTETYDQTSHTIKEGDTLTRSVSLQAVAMPAQLIPALTFKPTKEFNVYPESPEEKNEVQFNELVGTRTIKLTYLMNKAGKITLPAIQVPWFNTVTGKAEIAELKPHTLTVKPGKQTKSTPPPPDKQPTSLSTISNPEPIPTTKPTSHSTIWALALGFIAAWGLILLGWLLRRTNRFNRHNHVKRAIKQVQAACKKNNPTHARRSLLRWASIQWPEADILNFQDIARLTRDTALKNQLLLLSEALYNPNHQTSWQGAGLLRSFNAYLHLKPSVKPNQKRPDLPPMNPASEPGCK